MNEVFQDVLGHVEVDALIRKRQRFEVFAPHPVADRAAARIGPPLRREVARALRGELYARAAATGGGFVDPEAAPLRVERLDDGYQGALPGNAPTLSADEMIAQPLVVGGKDRLPIAGRADPRRAH